MLPISDRVYELLFGRPRPTDNQDEFVINFIRTIHIGYVNGIMTWLITRPHMEYMTGFNFIYANEDKPDTDLPQDTVQPVICNKSRHINVWNDNLDFIKKRHFMYQSTSPHQRIEIHGAKNVDNNDDG